MKTLIHKKALEFLCLAEGGEVTHYLAVCSWLNGAEAVRLNMSIV